MRFVKAIILIFVLSSNFMLGQKTESLNDKRCGTNSVKGEPIRLEILQLQPNLIESLAEKCLLEENLQANSLEMGAFFRLTAL